MGTIGYSRREFLRQGGAFSALILAGGAEFAAYPGAAGNLEILVIGDSLTWGQGLRDEHKFSTLTKNWLQTDLLNGSSTVNVKVKAHSGATLTLHEHDAARLKRAGRDESQGVHPEINISFPSITKQIELASGEYSAAGLPAESVGLILLSGGVSDIGVSKVLDSSADDEELHRDVVRYCRDDMAKVLRHAASAFPLAKIAVIGYFPMVSPDTPASRVINAHLEIRRLADPLKPLVNNPLIRLFIKSDKKRAVQRSRIWFEESTRNLQLAVDSFNSKAKRPSAVFIKSPLTEDNAFATKNTMLFRMKDGKPEDFHYETRKMVCERELKQVIASTGGKHSIRLCEIAAIGHPNVEGSRRYAEAIKASEFLSSIRA